jgi:hypothetical protein
MRDYFPSKQVKDVQVTEEAFGFQKRTSNTSKHDFFFKFLLLWVIFALLDPDPLTRLNPDPIRIRIQYGSGSATLPGGPGFTDLQATDGVVHGVGLAGNVLFAVDEAGQAAQVRQVDTRCENLSVSAVRHTGKEKVEGYRTELANRVVDPH